MNVQQAASIYVRGVFEQSRDELADLIHADFTKMHGADLAIADEDAIGNAIDVLTREIGLTVTDIDMRAAVETLRADAWEAIEGAEVEG